MPRTPPVPRSLIAVLERVRSRGRAAEAKPLVAAPGTLDAKVLVGRTAGGAKLVRIIND
jgi:hypothetical protein